MSELIYKTIDAIQDVNEKIKGIEFSPHLEDYPTSLDSLQLPCSLTDITDGTQFFMDCANNRIIFNLTSVILLERAEKGFYGPLRVLAANLSDAFRNTYFDGQTYLYQDYSRKLVDTPDNLIYIDVSQPFLYSGYQGNLNYPVGSTNFFHGFTVTFRVIGLGGGCT
jgi:hypothetical protein